MLLEHTVGNLDPLYIVSLVPDGLEIPRYVCTRIYLLKFYKISYTTIDKKKDLPWPLVEITMNHHRIMLIL
jgi:hypothetical protein